ncbi:hypothetical protein C5C07_20090 [Haloferax sp. Atlit-4N]|nr:hypothetical protein C5C07_20090 [Haloferax sp. Atlit-4N]
MSESPRAELRMHVTQAYTRTHEPAVKQHLEAALEVFEAVEEELRTCSQCGKQGLPERIRVHNCHAEK